VKGDLNWQEKKIEEKRPNSNVSHVKKERKTKRNSFKGGKAKKGVPLSGQRRGLFVVSKKGGGGEGSWCPAVRGEKKGRVSKELDGMKRGTG